MTTGWAKRTFFSLRLGKGESGLALLFMEEKEDTGSEIVCAVVEENEDTDDVDKDVNENIDEEEGFRPAGIRLLRVFR